MINNSILDVMNLNSMMKLLKKWLMKNLQKEIQLLLNLYKLKNLTEASLLNKKLIDDYPNVVILYNIMGLILTEQNNIEEDIKCYKNGIKIEPTYAMIYNNLGSIYKSKASYIKAENYYNKAISLDNKIPEPHNNLGSLYDQLDKFNNAIECFKNAINISIYYIFAFLYLS